ncbi:hypothetical protein ACHAXN_000218, partial [Cyclotella atomus]
MSSIFLMKKGMPPEAAYLRAATMASLERSVRTATGTSTETYQHDPGQPSLPGEGQGKADSMAIWTLISSEILLMHGKMCHGLEMTDVTGTKVSSRVDDAYVDDTDTYAMAPNTKRALCKKNKHTLIRCDVLLDRKLGKWINATRHIEYNEYRTNRKFFQRQTEGFKRLCEKKGTNYFVDEGVCDQLPLAAHPSVSIRTLRNNLQPAHPYRFKMITPEEDAEIDEATKDDPDYIYAAENIIAASDSSVDPVS